ncbi:MAG TPA: hypothetical protein QGF02_00155 [Candidatus Babeliales bacterium]|nr:hypothetical protein [Candidatus Babeliales bacterium]
MKKYILIIAILLSGNTVLGKQSDETHRLNELLHDAILAENHDLIKERVESGANINGRRSHNWTPLMFATFSCANPETIQLITTLGGDPSLLDSDNKTAYMIATEECPRLLPYLRIPTS